MVMDFELTELDYDAFFNRNVDWHDELDEITSSTKQKLKTVMFRMLREAGIITNDNLIIQAILSERSVFKAFLTSSKAFCVFPFLK